MADNLIKSPWDACRSGLAMHAVARDHVTIVTDAVRLTAFIAAALGGLAIPDAARRAGSSLFGFALSIPVRSRQHIERMTVLVTKTLQSLNVTPVYERIAAIIASISDEIQIADARSHVSLRDQGGE
jgi:hypothetical protein